MKRKKRDKVERAYTQGFKAGIRGHEMESNPFNQPDPRGAWYGGWREGRSNYIAGFLSLH